GFDSRFDEQEFFSQTDYSAMYVVREVSHDGLVLLELASELALISLAKLFAGLSKAGCLARTSSRNSESARRNRTRQEYRPLRFETCAETSSACSTCICTVSPGFNSASTCSLSPSCTMRLAPPRRLTDASVLSLSSRFQNRQHNGRSERLVY